jgi:altronate hydrolase
MNNEKLIKIHPKDKVAVALVQINYGESITVGDNTVIASENIGVGHKIALHNIAEGENIIKYGFPIGHATKAIKAGEHIHIHNTKTNLKGLVEYSYTPLITPLKINARDEFMGYERENGEVGIRNELWIVPTVGCVNGIADMIIERFKLTADVSKINAVVAFKHNYGCSQLEGQKLENVLKEFVQYVIKVASGEFVNSEKNNFREISILKTGVTL